MDLKADNRSSGSSKSNGSIVIYIPSSETRRRCREPGGIDPGSITEREKNVLVSNPTTSRLEILRLLTNLSLTETVTLVVASVAVIL
jgi:hypothetical protein